ncbi:YdjY domain-containing protein [Haloferula sp. A504]|uniref:YdjY domain-containing protein n=1 Tax=Haloferula sp. A504 TaxID=3373601 RepID=UPI0031BDD1A4|nr:YdjY domain-containing protein [Verrucomicrobiaceae bacterium E54]
MKLPLQWLWIAMASATLMAEESTGRAPVEPDRLPAPDQEVAEVTPAIEKLEDGQMKIGQVTFDPRSRRIRFPAAINQTEGLLEFLIVHQNGKIHESLLVTDISATNLNLAFKLLRYKASRELYYKLEADGTHTSEFQEATPEEKRESRIRILVEREVDGRTESIPVREWINHATTEQSMPDSPWVYGGSFLYNGRFVAESTGDLAAIFLSNTALINFSGKDNELDEVWLPHPTRVPPEGTPVTVIIEPYKS